MKNFDTLKQAAGNIKQAADDRVGAMKATAYSQIEEIQDSRASKERTRFNQKTIGRAWRPEVEDTSWIDERIIATAPEKQDSAGVSLVKEMAGQAKDSMISMVQGAAVQLFGDIANQVQGAAKSTFQCFKDLAHGRNIKTSLLKLGIIGFGLAAGTLGGPIGMMVGASIATLASQHADKVFKDERYCDLSTEISDRVKESHGWDRDTLNKTSAYLYNRMRATKDPAVKAALETMLEDGIQKGDPNQMNRIVNFMKSEHRTLKKASDPAERAKQMEQNTRLINDVNEQKAQTPAWNVAKHAKLRKQAQYLEEQRKSLELDPHDDLQQSTEILSKMAEGSKDKNPEITKSIETTLSDDNEKEVRDLKSDKTEEQTEGKTEQIGQGPDQNSRSDLRATSSSQHPIGDQELNISSGSMRDRMRNKAGSFVNAVKGFGQKKNLGLDVGWKHLGRTRRMGKESSDWIREGIVPDKAPEKPDAKTAFLDSGLVDYGKEQAIDAAMTAASSVPVLGTAMSVIKETGASLKQCAKDIRERRHLKTSFLKLGAIAVGGIVGFFVGGPPGMAVGASMGAMASRNASKLVKQERYTDLSAETLNRIKDSHGWEPQTTNMLSQYIYNRYRVTQDPEVKRALLTMLEKGFQKGDPHELNRAMNYMKSETQWLNQECNNRPTAEQVKEEMLNTQVKISERRATLEKTPKYNLLERNKIKNEIKRLERHMDTLRFDPESDRQEARRIVENLEKESTNPNMKKAAAEIQTLDAETNIAYERALAKKAGKEVDQKVENRVTQQVENTIAPVVEPVVTLASPPPQTMQAVLETTAPVIEVKPAITRENISTPAPLASVPKPEPVVVATPKQVPQPEPEPNKDLFSTLIDEAGGKPNSSSDNESDEFGIGKKQNTQLSAMQLSKAQQTQSAAKPGLTVELQAGNVNSDDAKDNPDTRRRSIRNR